LDVLQLSLQILYRFIQLGNARLELVEGVVQRLHLAGDGIQLTVARLALRVNLLLQGVDSDGHLVGVVGGLFHQVLQDAEAAIQGGLEPLHHVEQLLHLGLQLDDLLRGRVRGNGRGGQEHGEDSRGEETIAKVVRFQHISPIRTGNRDQVWFVG